MSTNRARAGPRQGKGNLKSGHSQHINQKKKKKNRNSSRGEDKRVTLIWRCVKVSFLTYRRQYTQKNKE